MKVLQLSWCESHHSEMTVGGLCWRREVGEVASKRPCQMVEMELHPAGSRVVTANALVLSKVDGKWVINDGFTEGP